MFQGMLERNSIKPDLALLDDRLVIFENVFYRVFQGNNVLLLVALMCSPWPPASLICRSLLNPRQGQ
jgi:hypothetical protein